MLGTLWDRKRQVRGSHGERGCRPTVTRVINCCYYSPTCRGRVLSAPALGCSAQRQREVTAGKYLQLLSVIKSSPCTLQHTLPFILGSPASAVPGISPLGGFTHRHPWCRRGRGVPWKSPHSSVSSSPASLDGISSKPAPSRADYPTLCGEDERVSSL